MRLVPFESVDGEPFTLRRDEVLQRRGAPAHQHRNDVGLTALDYGHTVYRFQDCGRLEEVTCAAEVVHFGPVAVPFHQLEGFVRAHDAAAFCRMRFLVSPAFGLAFDPAEPPWVTALARHCLPEWEAL